MEDTANIGLDAAFWITSVVVLLLLMFSGFCSGSETALTAASRAKLRAQADRGSKGAAKALEIKEDDERLIGAILMGNNLANVIATSLATAMLTRLFGANGVALASLVMTAMILIFAEVMPKTYAISAPERAAGIAAGVVAIMIKVLSPFVAGVRVIVRATLRIFGVRVEAEDNMLSVREEIMGALQIGHAEGAVEKEDRDRLLGALDLADRTVEEIMLHRSSIEMIDVALPPGEILSAALQSRHTRLPLYRDNTENIVGVIHAKDLARAMDKLVRKDIPEFNVLDVAMEAYFVPETTTLDDQMREFLRRRAHFALVVDEYGSLQGLITLEDILEEIVGEIADEFDHDEDEVAQTADGQYLVDGGMTIRDLNRAHDWTLPDEEANTVAGLVIHEAQMIPTVGQVFSFHGFRFEVVEKDANRLTKLKVRAL
ncbi:MAG: HlyC/CorC family transporter [Pseudomonadota bacterium]